MPAIDETDLPSAVWTLHLAGLDPDAIGRQLEIPLVAVDAMLEQRRAAVQDVDGPAAHAVELARVDALWQALYDKAGSGDPESVLAALELSRYRTDLLARYGRRPQPETPVEPVQSIRAGWLVLAGGAERVANVLVDIAVHGRDERARIAAATAVLDRVGIPAKVDVGVSVTPQAQASVEGMSATQILEQRMQLLGITADSVVDAVDTDGSAA